jgi:hypothetical protein
VALNTDADRISWSPDLISSFDADDLVPEALILRTGSLAGFVDGDAPSVRVPYVPTDAAASVTAEGATMTAVDPDLDEIVVQTDKVTQLVKVSREQIELLEMHKDGIVVAEYWTALPPKAELEERLRVMLREAQERISRRELPGPTGPA